MPDELRGSLRSMSHLTNLYNYRDLLMLWTGREIRVRYKQSLLGVGWAIIQPLVLTVVFTLVFSRIMQVNTGGVPYPIFAYAALVPESLHRLIDWIIAARFSRTSASFTRSVPLYSAAKFSRIWATSG